MLCIVNTVTAQGRIAVTITNIENNSYIYNVHSYYAEDSEYTIAKCSYGLDYAAAIKKDNYRFTIHGLKFSSQCQKDVILVDKYILLKFEVVPVTHNAEAGFVIEVMIISCSYHSIDI